MLVAVGKHAKPGGSSPVPRYGVTAGVAWSMVAADAAMVEGVCRSKLRIESEMILQQSPDTRALAAVLVQLQRLQVCCNGKVELVYVLGGA